MGGAYGCMANFKRDGNTYFVSYRDPNLATTNEEKEKTTEFLADFDCNERDMTKYIIGTISNIDIPYTPYQEGEHSISGYIQGITDEMIEKSRMQVLNATPSDIRDMSTRISEVLREDSLVVLGSESSIDANANMFDSIETLK